MTNITRFGLTALLLTAVAGGVSAQQNNGTAKPATDSATTKTRADTAKEPQKISLFRPMEINHIRPADQRGINVFESPKESEVPFTGFALSFGGAFTQEFQGLAHQNSADAGPRRTA